MKSCVGLVSANCSVTPHAGLKAVFTIFLLLLCVFCFLIIFFYCISFPC